MEAVNSVDYEENGVVLSDDPKLLDCLINQHVKVKMIKSCTYAGFIHAIDPISKSLILSVPKDDNFQTVLIPGHAVVSLTKTQPLTCEKPRRKTLATFTEEEIVMKRDKVVAWLKKNLLPAKIQSGAIDIAYHAVVCFTKTEPLTCEKPRRNTLATFTEEEIVMKREKVVLPAKIQSGAIDIGNVLILAPFSSNNICTENSMVAGQIRKLLESMPDDFEA